MADWIPCSERMPNDDEQVMVWVESGHIAEDWVDKDTGDFMHYPTQPAHPRGFHATHWQPLPEPPENK